MHKSYMSDYWRGRGIQKDRIAELLAELSDLTGGKSYSKRTVSSYGEDTVQLVVEYDVARGVTDENTVNH